MDGPPAAGTPTYPTLIGRQLGCARGRSTPTSIDSGFNDCWWGDSNAPTTSSTRLGEFRPVTARTKEYLFGVGRSSKESGGSQGTPADTSSTAFDSPS